MPKVGDIHHQKVLPIVAHIINHETILRLERATIVAQDLVIIRVNTTIRLLFFEDYLKRRFLASLAVV